MEDAFEALDDVLEVGDALPQDRLPGRVGLVSEIGSGDVKPGPEIEAGAFETPPRVR
ncbi:MAG TPA: hypothetical protein VF053_16280 [Streptosporangiales bacterium]